jgi:hypothetical protein
LPPTRAQSRSRRRLLIREFGIDRPPLNEAGCQVALYGYDWFYLSPDLDALTERWLLQPIRSHWLPNSEPYPLKSPAFLTTRGSCSSKPGVILASRELQ